MIHPTIDINLFVHDGARTVAAAIDSVLAQTWPHWRLTLIDDGSTDATPAILDRYAASDPRITLKRNRCNTGAVGAFQRGLWLGNADYVMPKSADDLIAPDFIEAVLPVLHAYPDCAMAHAAGLSFDGPGDVRFAYPPDHCLHAVGADPLARAGAVMRTYTSSPAFWGIYRRDAVDRLAPIAQRAGWDHVLLAELALYGEIRHVPQVLYWRRGVGRPLRQLARAATQEGTRGLSPDDPLADPLWRVPCLTTAYAHIENFAVARLPPAQRDRLIADARRIFAWRWGGMLRRELQAVRSHVETATEQAAGLAADARRVIHLHLTRLLAAAGMVLPAADLAAGYRAIAALVAQEEPCPV